MGFFCSASGASFFVDVTVIYEMYTAESTDTVSLVDQAGASAVIVSTPNQTDSVRNLNKVNTLEATHAALLKGSSYVATAIGVVKGAAELASMLI